MDGWSDDDYELLFGGYPPTERDAPLAEDCHRLGLALGRSSGAVLAQWNDGRSLVLGHTNDASAGLRDFLVRRGWL